MGKNLSKIPKALKQRFVHYRNDMRVGNMAKFVKENSPEMKTAPVIFFNASTRLKGMSLNAGFSLISSWAASLQGVPVIHFVCDSGMPYCMLGSILNNPTDKPPCDICTGQSRKLFQNSDVRKFQYDPPQELSTTISQCSLDELMDYRFGDIPLGELVLPAIRWVLRCYHLPDNEGTRFLFRQYIMAAEGIARQFKELIEKENPRKVVVFNGMSFPEATVRWVAIRNGIPVITHEVGLQPYTAYFTDGQATAYPIYIPDSFSLDEMQNKRLNQYLEQRFQGNFSMAGVRFWPTMKVLSESFLNHASKFKQIIPIFTNVIFDTSQSHANTIFDHMFDWLDSVLEIVKQHPETLFVVRAHPDEARPGKASQESVAAWAKQNRIETLENVVFVDAVEYFSSYELIQKSKFVMIYNSTIGMEATLLGIPVLCAGKARFNQIPTVFFPESKEQYLETLEKFLSDVNVNLPEEFVENTRKFLYTQLYKVSLPFNDYLEEDQVWNGYVRLREFDWAALLPENSPVIKILMDGLLSDQPFEMKI
jgi:hypothetical protein